MKYVILVKHIIFNINNHKYDLMSVMANAKCELEGSLGIAPTFLKLDSWSPGIGFISIISTME